MSNSSIWPIHKPLSGATNPGLRRPGSNGNERALHIPQSASISGISPSECSVLYPRHSLEWDLTLLQRFSRVILPHQEFSVIYPGHSLVGRCYPSAEMQPVYYTAPANWTIEREEKNAKGICTNWNAYGLILDFPSCRWFHYLRR